MIEGEIVKISEIKFVPEYYPRASGKAWWMTVFRYSEEMKAGAKFPPIDLGEYNKELILVDGAHRIEALKLNKEEYVRARITKYDDEKDIFIAAVQANIIHGKQLSPRDKVRIIAKLEDFGFTPAQISDLVRVQMDKLVRFTSRTIKGPRGRVYLKSPLAKLVEKGLISRDAASNAQQGKLSTRTVSDLLVQIILLLEDEVYPWEDKSVSELTEKLFDLLGQHISPITVMNV